MASTPIVSKKMFDLTLKLYGYSIAEENVRCLPDYSATLQFIANGTLRHVKQNGFYCFGAATKKDDAEVVAGGDDFIESGRRIERLEKAFRELSPAPKNDTNLRILRITALAVEAVWRPHESDPDKDVFVPFYSSVKAIVALERYSGASLLAILQLIAQRKLARTSSVQPF